MKINNVLIFTFEKNKYKMSFKLLAIRPLDDCNPKFLKNLEENRIYKFYNDYEFIGDDNQEIKIFGKGNYKEVKHIKPKEEFSVPENLYGEKINISAIVGKNGSGKSSLVELLYAFFYQLSISEGVIKLFDFSEVVNYNLFEEKRVKFLNLNLNEDYKVFENEKEYLWFKRWIEDIYYEYLGHLNPKIEYDDNNFKNENFEIIRQLEKWKYFFDNKLIYYLDNLFVEVYYKIDESFYLLKLDKKSNNQVLQYEFVNRKWEESKIIDKTIFYNLIVNYSLYGLNSNELGDWVDRIFHKNDGYQTPIVLNPYRENGIIDINKENELSKDRLLSNILNVDESAKTVSVGKKIMKLSLEYNYENYNHLNDDFKYLDYKFKYLEKIINSFKNSPFEENIKKEKIEEIIKSNDIVINQATDYILFKLQKISKTYNNNDTDFCIVDYENKETLDKFLDNIVLNDHGSHITFKIRQVINFLRYDLFPKNEVKIQYNQQELNSLSISISNLLNSLREEYYLNIKKKHNPNIILLPFWLISNVSFLPPSFFDVDYEFSDNSKFSSLSSGETQKIYSLNTILYHIINLNYQSKLLPIILPLFHIKVDTGVGFVPKTL